MSGIALSRLGRRLALDGPALDRAGQACLLLLPPMLLHGRGIADILICLIDLMFLARCARAGDWAWLRQGWVALAAAFWLWMQICSLRQGDIKPIGQGVVTIRLLLLAAAAQNWLLLAPAAQRRLAWVFTGCAAWLVLEVWQQYLLGSNLAGYPRAKDGIFTGPFQKERAGPLYLYLFFPGVLPLAMRGLSGASWRARAAGLALLAFAAACMVLIGQRMPTLLLLLGLVATGVLVRQLRWQVGAVLAVCAGLAALLPIVSPPTFQRLVVHFLEQMGHFWTSDYGQIYVRALEMIRLDPWFGLGYDGFRNHCLDAPFLHGNAWVGVADADIDIPGGCNIHPHNYWLEIGTAFGLPGLALFTALAGAWLWRIGREMLRHPTPLQTALCIAAIVMLWPVAARSSLFVVDAGGWAFLIAGWGMAAARGRDIAADV